ncbi:hypothetical protein [Streptomyces achromogenes]|uniref:hypothetical protein n=1 Tax=Streptomyces achromogenes TaxID=67255 RepID=UPI003710B8E7
MSTSRGRATAAGTAIRSHSGERRRAGTAAGIAALGGVGPGADARWRRSVQASRPRTARNTAPVMAASTVNTVPKT